MFIQNGVIILGAFAAFGAIHSLMAGARLKERLIPVLGERFTEGWYRLAYNALSGVTVFPVLLAIVLLPDRLLYQLASPWSVLLRLVQLAGLAGLVGALFVTDVWHFAGIKQAAAYLNADPLPLPAPDLQEKGMYRYVRHPLYFFSLALIWATPVLTINWLWFNVGATLYFAVGSLVEEQRLVRAYGDAYRQYQARVSWLIPWFPAHRDPE